MTGRLKDLTRNMHGKYIISAKELGIETMPPQELEAMLGQHHAA